MNIKDLALEGCQLISLPHSIDERGHFVKTFNKELFANTELYEFDLQEEFYTISKKNVLRGLHFQNNPAAHSKVVSCIDGKVLDFCLDLRASSPSYKKHISMELDSETPQLLFLPKGIAHGFLTISKSATLLYKTDSVYSPENDSGILWSSIGLTLPNDDFIVSERDKAFISLSEFESDFI
ncbi:dTDP-4-keto-6-deoxy-D-glucose epimerase [Alginatibacterium sediminis]|uniref:dTDP-4-dehydrorhamnose 3,5-epimerase n=1 Tax=Alginatibacterium sediminis TaxID=2164068 RepID=A0A420EAU8_9ALTE|nr:dTDP-4-dehydrorhamnose 3,5-epimerase family protein [Alginatibacterium sediminis]RKF17819.1 dTDP-4-keto-6-deoxy-D-glucose epimerase [Alginatibacterium sediminis]